jgi:hypothetical protein
MTSKLALFDLLFQCLLRQWFAMYQQDLLQALRHWLHPRQQFILVGVAAEIAIEATSARSRIGSPKMLTSGNLSTSFLPSVLPPGSR